MKPERNQTYSRTDAFFRSLVCRRLKSLRGGEVVLVDGSDRMAFGEKSELRTTIQINHPRFYRRIALGGGLGAAEALMDGDWSCDDLVSMVRIFTRNLSVSDRFDRGLAILRKLAAKVQHWSRRNSRSGSKKNISEHYDLGNDLYELFLDETMCYSSAIFPTEESTLREGSVHKLDRVCQKLGLRPGMRVVEVGCGWGGFAIHAAKNYQVHVTATTISKEQFAMAQKRIREAGVEHLVDLVMTDYRDLQGKFDRLVSIEMIEAVGDEFYEEFFGKCASLLGPQGEALIQAIVIRDQRYQQHLKSVDFIRKYIFPGGCLPSITRLCDASTRGSDMRLVHIEEFSDHYAKTLNLWREAFLGELDQVRALGYSERFIRMWEYYFAYCEAVFLERQVNVVQAWWAKPKAKPNVAGLVLARENWNAEAC